MRLMSGFYGRLLTPNAGRSFPGLSGIEGSPADKATALAAAQREFIARGGRESHPYFWAAFVLVGQMN
jgi:hypothetical protein